jgi:hypothetical protein
MSSEANRYLRKSANMFLIIYCCEHLRNNSLLSASNLFQVAILKICERSELNFRQCRRRQPLALGEVNFSSRRGGA